MKKILLQILCTLFLSQVAVADLSVTQLNGFSAGGGVPGFVFGSTDSSITDLTTYTFTAMSLGTDADRSAAGAICAFRAAAGRSLTSITIGGQTASVVAVNGGSVSGDVYLATATGVAGTTGDVVMTLSAGAVRAACHSFSVYNVNATPTTFKDTDSALTTTVNCGAGGVIVSGGGRWSAGTGTGPLTWTGLTERGEVAVESNNVLGIAIDSFAAAQSSLTVSFSGVTGEIIAGCFVP